jgi:hypothetical protein
MNRKVWIGLGAAVAAVLVAWYAASPFMAMSALQKAARARDRDRLEELVDFPSVRENLKADFTAGLMKKAENDAATRDNPFAGLAAMLVPALVDRVVDAAVTPEGIARLQDGKGVATPPGAKPMGKASTPAKPQAKTEDEPKLAYHYSGLNRFKVEQTTDAGPMTWVLARQGLFGWKLVRIELPPKLFDQG